MTEEKILAEKFEANRGHLHSVAYRMLGSRAEADDAVQEAWLRLARGGADGVDNFAGWLTTITARVCLDMLRSRKARHEVPVDASVETLKASDDLERERQLADSVGVAMLVVLENLTPAERVAFVLHDVFNVSFEEIAPVVGRSALAARQLASRGRRRIQGAQAEPQADRERQREVVGAFLAASQAGDFTALLSILDPDVVLRADDAAVQGNATRGSQSIPGLGPEVRGRDAVAGIFRGRLRAAQPALVDGYSGLVFAFAGQARLVVDVVVENDRIAEINLIGNADRIAALDVAF